ncbi:hypothetical protein WJX72_011886 [[Myrmecia] bisecta]|uniref:Fe2OG dioxygenase domain-containing protein n=1 Tax=[Myrmecia] bisecta TaxID=41462 RepID=A0AAW1R8Y4_9CHLO
MNATFSCGGTLDRGDAPFWMVYVADGEADPNLHELDLPHPGTGALEKLANACSLATFGNGKEDVLDLNYRRALKLDPACFVTNFALAEHDILREVASVMMPSAAGIRAKLYKLNVHRKGDLFKAYVDTPTSSDMFGSLVVCLSSEHTGGALRITQNGVSVKYDCGGKAASNAVQWMAFYSDCEHEVEEVTSGYRITLTYNLYADSAPEAQGSQPVTKLDTAAPALHTCLTEALQNPSFMPGGGALGFACQHAYPHTDEGLARNLAPLLKGADAAVFATAAQLGLKPTLKAVWDTAKYNGPDWEDNWESELADEEEGQDAGDEDDRAAFIKAHVPAWGEGGRGDA